MTEPKYQKDAFSQSTKEKSETGVRMPLCYVGSDDEMFYQADGDEKARPMFLIILGPEAPDTKRVFSKIQNRITAQREKKNHTPSNDELERLAVTDSKLLAEITVGGEYYQDGWVTVTKENAYDLLIKVEGFRDQIYRFVADKKNFTTG